MSGPTWSDVHHSIDPGAVPFLQWWLRFVQALARPLRRVPPTALTVAGVLLVVAAIPLATALPLAGLACVLLGALCDALDGAVAVGAGRVTYLGGVADATADRIADIALAVVVWRCGAPWWLAALAGLLSFGHEAVRRFVPATRRMVTVDERPSRVICAAAALVSRAITPATWPATVAAAVWVGLALLGLGQFARRVRTQRRAAAIRES